jgi:GNAT superfamily N-acetyltransferase
MENPAPGQVREAREEDLPRLLVLLQQLSEGGAGPESAVQQPTTAHSRALAELLHGPYWHLLVVETSGQVVGTCILYVMPNLSHGAAPWGLVENVVVDVEQRSHGYGELLMAEVARLSRHAGCYKVALMSNLRRTDAHRFYERIGYGFSHKGFSVYPA